MMFMNYISKPVANSFKRALSFSPICQRILKIQDKEDFDQHVNNCKVPVIVDFFATWCGPCKILQPLIENIVDEQNGKIHLLKVDIDDHAEIAMDFGISVVPVLVSMIDGKVKSKIIGSQDEDQLRNFVTKLIEESNVQKEKL
ncbi:thioredoxin, mitochondrial-like isoform X2 [Daktulosphaira vitifoliae]|nr:thioredoxin, mitochondrial-like isoform X2 [Daktulosphaira vitifoliae]